MGNEALEAKRRRVEKIQRAQAIMDAENGGPMEAAAAEENNSGLAKTLRAFDVPRASSGGPLVATAIEALSGKKVINPGEYEKALHLQGDYPSTSEMLNRAGYLQDSPYLRGGAGFVGDVLSDPTTILGGFVGRAAGKAGAGAGIRTLNYAMNPLESVAKIRSSQLYKKAFKKIDDEAMKLGKTLMPSDILQKLGYRGNMKGAQTALEQVNKEAGSGIGSVLKEAQSKGAKIKIPDAMQEAMGYASELRGKATPEAAELAKQIDDRIAYAWEKSGGELGVADANELKSFINNLIKTSGYQAGPEAALTTQARKEIASGLAKGVPEAVTGVDKNLGQKLREHLQRFASTDPNIIDKTTQLANQAAEVRGPWGVTPIDLALLGGGAGSAMLTGGNPINWGIMALAGKKIGQAAMSTAGRTTRAAAANFLGNQTYHLMDPAARWGAWMLPRQGVDNE